MCVTVTADVAPSAGCFSPFASAQVSSINLAGLDRVLMVLAAGVSERSLLIRQYKVAFKKSGTKVRVKHWRGEAGGLNSSCTWGARPVTVENQRGQLLVWAV